MVEKGEPAKVVVELDARLKDSESKLEESVLRVAKEKKTSKELEEELGIYKKEAVEQH